MTMIRDLLRTTLGLALALSGASGLAAADDPAATEREQARACVARRDWAEAIAHLDRVIAAHPDDAEALVDRGRCHARRDDKARAGADFDRAIALRPTWAEAWAERGQLRVEGADPAPALADLAEALRLDPTQDEARQARMGLSLLRGDLDAVLADCNALVDRRADDPTTYEVRGLIRLARRDGGGAAVDFDEVIRRETLLDTSEMILFRAVAHLLAGRNDLARRDFDQFFEHKPDNPTALVLRGTLRLVEGQLAEAKSDAEAVLATRPDDLNALNLRLSVAFAEKRFADARAVVDRLIAAEPDRPKHLNARAAIRREVRDEEGALADHERVLGWEPDKLAVADLARALSGQAWIWATSPDDRRRDGPRALRAAERACVLIDPPGADTLEARAAAHAELGQFDEAIHCAERARAAAQSRATSGVRTALVGGTLTIKFDADLLVAGPRTPPQDESGRALDAYRQRRPYREPR